MIKPFSSSLRRLFRTALVGAIIFLISISSVLSIYANKDSAISTVSKLIPGSVYGENAAVENSIWAKKILKGGYILHFRHAERDKWIDVHMYDILESKFHKTGDNGTAFAEQKYYKDAVCLNDRGLVQARAMGEVIRKVNLPISKVFTSPSCRARQTAELAFGGYDSINLLLLHEGAFDEDIRVYRETLKRLYQGFPDVPGKNTVVSAHNSVVNRDMFINGKSFSDDFFQLEEGGFYVISKTDTGLKLEHKYYYFLDFARANFSR